MEKIKFGTYTLEKYTVEEAKEDYAVFAQESIAGYFKYMYMLYKEQENGSYGFSSEEVMLEYAEDVFKCSVSVGEKGLVGVENCKDFADGLAKLKNNMWQW